MKMPYGELSGQPHYSKISPKRIIAEELLVQPECPDKSLFDYKFKRLVTVSMRLKRLHWQMQMIIYQN